MLWCGRFIIDSSDVTLPYLSEGNSEREKVENRTKGTGTCPWPPKISYCNHRQYSLFHRPSPTPTRQTRFVLLQTSNKGLVGFRTRVLQRWCWLRRTSTLQAPQLRRSSILDTARIPPAANLSSSQSGSLYLRAHVGHMNETRLMCELQCIATPMSRGCIARGSWNSPVVLQ